MITNLFTLVVIIFWALSFILDYFYYNKLLQGAVIQAQKLDQSSEFNKLGLFGMSECIKNQINTKCSNALVLSYYLIPAIIIGTIWFFYK